MNANKNVDNFFNYFLLGLSIIFSIYLFKISYDRYNIYTNSISSSSLSSMPNEGWILLVIIGSILLLNGLGMIGVINSYKK
jgi:hypothetical protein